MRRGILTGLALPAAAAYADAIPPYKTVLISRQSDADGGRAGNDDTTNLSPETAGTDPSYRGWTFLRDVDRGRTTWHSPRTRSTSRPRAGTAPGRACSSGTSSPRASQPGPAPGRRRR